MTKKSKPISAAQTEALQKALEEAELKIKALNTLLMWPKNSLKLTSEKSLVPSSPQNETRLSQVRDRCVMQTVWQN